MEYRITETISNEEATKLVLDERESAIGKRNKELAVEKG